MSCDHNWEYSSSKQSDRIHYPYSRLHFICTNCGEPLVIFDIHSDDHWGETMSIEDYVDEQ